MIEIKNLTKIYNQDNVSIHGVIGFIGALLKIIKMNNPDYIVVLFDKEQEILRQNINKNYKNNRIDYNKVPTDDNPFSQLENIYIVLDELNIKHTEVEIVETDDMIASYCFHYMNEYDIVISSFDTDFYSLVNNHVKIFRYRGKKSQLIDKFFIKEKFNIDCKYFNDYKALIGDSSDNIKESLGTIINGYKINQMLLIKTEMFDECFSNEDAKCKNSLENLGYNLKEYVNTLNDTSYDFILVVEYTNKINEFNFTKCLPGQDEMCRSFYASLGI